MIHLELGIELMFDDKRICVDHSPFYNVNILS